MNNPFSYNRDQKKEKKVKQRSETLGSDNLSAIFRMSSLVEKKNC